MSVSAVVVNKGANILQFRVEGKPLLQHIPAISMIKGDASLEFCPMAKAIIADDDISYIRLEKVQGKEFIAVGAEGKTVDISKGEKLQAIILAIRTALSGTDPVLFEDDLLKMCDAEMPPQNPGKFQSLVSEFMRDKVIPAVRKNTGHNDAEIRLIRMSPSKVDASKVNLEVTLHNSCATCSTSVLGTLNFAARSIQKHMFGPRIEQTGGKELSGFVVLPTKSGSPSFTHRPPRWSIMGEKPPKPGN